MYYAGMEKLLDKEVAEISKMKQPQQNYLASASIRPLSQNYLLVQRNFSKPERTQAKPVRKSRKVTDKLSIKRLQSIERGLIESSEEEEESVHDSNMFSSLHFKQETIHQLASLARIDKKETQPSPVQATLKVEVESVPKEKLNRDALKYITDNKFTFFAADFSISLASCFSLDKLIPLNYNPWSFHF